MTQPPCPRFAPRHLLAAVLATLLLLPAAWAAPGVAPQDIPQRVPQGVPHRALSGSGTLFVTVGPRTSLRGPPTVVMTLANHDDHLHVRIRPGAGARR